MRKIIILLILILLPNISMAENRYDDFINGMKLVFPEDVEIQNIERINVGQLEFLFNYKKEKSSYYIYEILHYFGIASKIRSISKEGNLEKIRIDVGKDYINYVETFFPHKDFIQIEKNKSSVKKIFKILKLRNAKDALVADFFHYDGYIYLKVYFKDINDLEKLDETLMNSKNIVSVNGLDLMLSHNFMGAKVFKNYKLKIKEEVFEKLKQVIPFKSLFVSHNIMINERYGLKLNFGEQYKAEQRYNGMVIGVFDDKEDNFVNIEVEEANDGISINEKNLLKEVDYESSVRCAADGHNGYQKCGSLISYEIYETQNKLKVAKVFKELEIWDAPDGDYEGVDTKEKIGPFYGIDISSERKLRILYLSAYRVGLLNDVGIKRVEEFIDTLTVEHIDIPPKENPYVFAPENNKIANKKLPEYLKDFNPILKKAPIGCLAVEDFEEIITMPNTTGLELNLKNNTSYCSRSKNCIDLPVEVAEIIVGRKLYYRGVYKRLIPTITSCNFQPN